MDHRAQAASALELSNELLRTIAGGLDLRDVFPQIAQTAGQLLHHDGLDLTVQDLFGNPTLRSRSTQELPEDQPALLAHRGEFYLVRDLQDVTAQDAGWEPRMFVERLAAAGYHSFLCARARSRERVIRLGFFSKRRAAYTLDDVPVARLIADAIAVAAAHEQLGGAQRAAEAPVLAECPDGQIRNVTVNGDRGGELRVIGQSAEWRQVLKKAAQVARTDTSVFLQGESGTGKEVVARFIHRASPRKSGPFVAINCAALPEHLLESELFGYERGAFTGAHQAKAGQIELASTGVLFLDEVSEMSPMAQAKMLRVLQEREFRRLGGTRAISANVRVIAASNRDLQRAVADGNFREDLFYRLQVFDIRMPPLRERRGDIPLLSEAFLQEFHRATGCGSAGLTPEAMEILTAHEWPGNVRELHNALERAAILCQGGLITGDHLALRSTSFAAPRRPNLSEVERRTVEQVLRESEGNKSKAARRLGITRTQLYCRLRKYGLGKPDDREQYSPAFPRRQ
ncbi:MAG TPA: sigma 54-interacting transcriptional regulator [Vicinamibacterales bacterium]|nr:sigma 54-interacting transcriptional regulator [Vicinamibacterales bacterium]